MANDPSSSDTHPQSLAPTMADLTPYDPSKFQHSPLNQGSKSIRLMRILPNGGLQIQCELHNFAMDECPPYVALSYTWNQDNRHKTIKCNGMSLQVGLNLWDFLFRYQFGASTYKDDGYLWIDALCIDQKDLKERNQQVALMREIYSTATSVIVWLGEEMGSVENASAFFPNSEAALGDLLGDLSQRISSSEWNALIEFLQKPYWRRVWVVQEFVLASTIAIWCGGVVLDTSGFEQLYVRMEALQACPLGVYTLVQRSPGWNLFRHRTLWRQSDNQQRHSVFRLSQLLFSFPTSKSTENCDKIYGLLGIVSDQTRNNHRIEADYEKSAVEVVVDVLKHQSSRGTGDGDLDSEAPFRLVECLLRLLKVSSEQFVLYILEQAPNLLGHLYQLATMHTTPDLPPPPLDSSRLESLSHCFDHCSWQSDDDVSRNRCIFDFLLRICHTSIGELAQYVINRTPNQRHYLRHLVPQGLVSVSFHLLSRVTHWEAGRFEVVLGYLDGWSRQLEILDMANRMSLQDNSFSVAESRLTSFFMNMENRVHWKDRRQHVMPHPFLTRRSLSSGQSLGAALSLRQPCSLRDLVGDVLRSTKGVRQSDLRASPVRPNTNRCPCTGIEDRNCGLLVENPCYDCSNRAQLVFSEGKHYIGITSEVVRILPGDYLFVPSSETAKPIALILRPKAANSRRWRAIGYASLYRLSDFDKLAWFDQAKSNEDVRPTIDEMRKICLNADDNETRFPLQNTQRPEPQGQQNFTIKVTLQMSDFCDLVERRQINDDFRVRREETRDDDRVILVDQRLGTEEEGDQDCSSDEEKMFHR